MVPVFDALNFCLINAFLAAVDQANTLILLPSFRFEALVAVTFAFNEPGLPTDQTASALSPGSLPALENSLATCHLPLPSNEEDNSCM